MTSSIEDEFDRYNRERLWEQVFNKLHNEATILHEHSSKDARKTENRERNRYRDVHPYDHTRVKLQGFANDYINASLIDVPLASRRYILTQGPLLTTCGHFWRMVWQEKTKGIIMLNKVIEKGDVKCHQYYPVGVENGGADNIEFPDVGLRVEVVGAEDCSYYVIRTFRLVDIKTEEVRVLKHFHYTTWPDFGVPQSPDAFLAFLRVVRESGCLESSADIGPAIVHCSAGIGRSGTFCLVDCALVLVSRTRSTSCLDLRSMLMDMRQCRAGLVQTPDQLRFCYLAVLTGARRILTGGGGEMIILASGKQGLSQDPAIVAHGNEAVPRPPQRSSSLPVPHASMHKSLSLDDRAAGINSDARSGVPPQPPPRHTLKEDKELHRAASLQEKQLSAPAVDGDYEGIVVPSSIELRRRKKEERLKNTADQLQRMRQKQQESELMRSRSSGHLRSSWLNVWTVSITVAVAAASYVYYRYF